MEQWGNGAMGHCYAANLLSARNRLGARNCTIFALTGPSVLAF